MKRMFFTLVLVVLSLSAIHSQDLQKYNRFWVQGSMILPLNEFDFSPGLKSAYELRGHWRQTYSESYSLEFGAGYKFYAGLDDAVDGSGYYKSDIFGADVRYLCTPFTTENSRPYFYAGLGLAYYSLAYMPRQVSPDDVEDSGIAAYLPLGIGIEWYVSEQLAFDFSLGGEITTTENLNYYNDGGLPDGLLKAGIGITYKFKPREKDEDKDGLDYIFEEKIGTNPLIADTDGDGLNDGEEVNKYKTNPLKADSDGDGLSDYDEIKKWDTNPVKTDSDGDKLNDYDEINKHKTDPLKVDSDGDSLNDYDELMKHKTNPLKKDTDDDGLFDNRELEKTKTDPLKKDTDSDKLNDGEEVTKYKTNPLSKDTDKGTVDDYTEVRRGTDPNDKSDDVIKKETAIVLEGIQFETGSADIKAESEVKLKEVLRTLNIYSDITVEIGGYTDNVGSASSNQKLSQARAESVRSWLIENGVKAARLEAKGYGESSPIANNNTKDGRAKNRRIEFKRVK